jgi:mannose-1-phosphate guanylyltransferase
VIETTTKPWGREELWARALGQYVGKFLYVDGGHRLSLQYHRVKDESMTLVSGSATLLLGDSIENLAPVRLRRGESVRIMPEQLHRLVAHTNSVICEVSTDHLDDVVRLEDDYHRAPPCLAPADSA